MILKELVDFWERQEEVYPTGYQPGFITKKISIGKDGKARLLPVGTTKRASRTGLVYTVPRVKRAGTGAKPCLLADNAVYTLGLARKKDKPADVAAKHLAFASLVQDCADETGDEDVGAVVRWLRSGGPEVLREDPSLQPDDDLMFEVDGRIVTDSPAVKSYLASRLAPPEDAERGFCLVTGRETAIARRHPYKIKGVPLGPSGQAQGSDLISIDNPSGMSYGLKNALNSPVAVPAAEAVCNALNRLLSDSRHSIRLGNVAYVWWLKGDDDFDLGAALNDPNPEDVAHYLRSVRDGGRAGSPGDADFFALALTNNVSRTVVREEVSTTLKAVQRRLGEWFGRLLLVGPDGGNAAPIGLWRIAHSMYRDPKKEIANSVSATLLGCALKGNPLPASYLQQAVRRNVVEQGPYQTIKGARRFSFARLCLIKAVLSGLHPELDLYKMLEDTSQPTPYVCGRLLAVLDTIQYFALRNPQTKKGPNATVVDRHYGAFSTTPALSIGPLVADATKAHLPKLRKGSPPNQTAGAALAKRLEEVMSLLPMELPSTLNYQDQGLFALGFYHQKAHDRAEAASARAKGVEAPLADLTDSPDLTTDKDTEE